jgi:hypothetical protein
MGRHVARSPAVTAASLARLRVDHVRKRAVRARNCCVLNVPYLPISIKRKAQATDADIPWCNGDIGVAVESLVTMKQSRANRTQARDLHDPATAGCLHTTKFTEGMPWPSDRSNPAPLTGATSPKGRIRRARLCYPDRRPSRRAPGLGYPGALRRLSLARRAVRP